MGYQVHITRKEYYFEKEGEPISLQEWLEYVESDEEMRLDGYADLETPDGVLRMEDDSLAVWKNWSKQGQNGAMAWFRHVGGNVSSTNPDVETLKKMHSISTKLSAKLQGEEGEIYNSDGKPNQADIKAEGEASSSLKLSSKKWWQFWK